MEMFQFDFMIRALIAGLVVGMVCPAVGVFLVMRRYSFMADTLAHVSLAGVAVGVMLNIYPGLTTLALALVAAVVIERLRAGQRLYGEAVLALVMSGGLALAVVLISLARGFNIDVFGYLFGSILTVSTADLWLILSLGVVVLGVIAYLFKEFYFISFDEECARVSGLAVDKLNFIFILLIAVTVSIAMRVVGTLLVSALMVIPVTTSLLVAKSFKQVFYTSVILGVAAALGGLTASYYVDIAAGGSIVLTAVVFFCACLAGKRLRETVVRRKLAKDSEKKLKTVPELQRNAS